MDSQDWRQRAGDTTSSNSVEILFEEGKGNIKKDRKKSRAGTLGHGVSIRGKLEKVKTKQNKIIIPSEDT